MNLSGDIEKVWNATMIKLKERNERKGMNWEEDGKEKGDSGIPVSSSLSLALAMAV